MNKFGRGRFVNNFGRWPACENDSICFCVTVEGYSVYVTVSQSDSDCTSHPSQREVQILNRVNCTSVHCFNSPQQLAYKFYVMYSDDILRLYFKNPVSVYSLVFFTFSLVQCACSGPRINLRPACHPEYHKRGYIHIVVNTVHKV